MTAPVESGLLSEFTCGVLAGFAKVTAGHPFDTIKGRVQSAQGFVTPVTAVRELLHADGVLGFYKGILPLLVTYGVTSGVLFEAHGVTKRWLLRTVPDPKTGQVDTNRKAELWELTVAGMVGGAAITPFLAPAEVIKLRRQVSSGEGRRGSVNHRGKVIEIIQQLAKTPRRFFSGGSITLVRECGTFGIFFPSNEIIRRKLQSPGEGSTHILSSLQPGERPLALWKRVVAGGLAGVLCWIPCYPIDRVKTEVQLAATKSSDSHVPSFIRATNAIYRRDGLRGFAVGIAPCLVRSFPAYAALYLTFDVLVHM